MMELRKGVGACGVSEEAMQARGQRRNLAHCSAAHLPRHQSNARDTAEAGAALWEASSKRVMLRWIASSSGACSIQTHMSLQL